MALLMESNAPRKISQKIMKMDIPKQEMKEVEDELKLLH